MATKKVKRLFDALKNCENEEEVKANFLEFFGEKLNARYGIDHYTPEILFEFKHNKNLQGITARARALAQTMYYVRRLKYECATLPIPPTICVVDKNKGFFVQTSDFYAIYSADKKYDWDRCPSDPCPILVDVLDSFAPVENAHVFSFENEQEEEIFASRMSLANQPSFFDTTKKVITEDNFTSVYAYWESLFGKYVKNGHKPSEYFISDIEGGRSQIIGNSEVLFRLNDGTMSKTVPMNEYQYFWNIYEKVHNPREIQALRQKIDRLSEDFPRRFTGEFYTPINFAKKAYSYIERVIGESKIESGKWRIWDMAAGTGNLEFVLPSSMLKNCYISTLLDDDAAYCKKIYPTATVFQYDYLNDDAFLIDNPSFIPFGVTPKMPQQLIEELADPEISWIIFINPPYGTSNNAKKAIGKKCKTGVSDTNIQKLMAREGLGATSRELFSQFLYRISIEFENKSAHLCLFSTLKYLNAPNDESLRNTLFQFQFEKGFMVSSKAFVGKQDKFPIGFLVWSLNKKAHIKDQKITLDIYNLGCEKIGTKDIVLVPRTKLLNKWPKHFKNTENLPPLSSGISVSSRDKDVRCRVAKDFLCSLMCCGNDIQNRNCTCLLSGPQASAGSFSVTPQNFERAMIVHAVRRISTASWINDRDQFSRPTSDDLPQEFVLDCVVWSAFSQYNESVSLKDVLYQGKTYQIENHLFPFLLSEVKEWPCDLHDIQAQLYTANEDRFLAKWFKAHQFLSPEAQAVVSAARKLYQCVYANLTKTNWLDYKIQCWDIGWWQIRKVSKEIGSAHTLQENLCEVLSLLANKIEPQIHTLGFLPLEMQPLPSTVEECLQVDLLKS